MHTLAHAPTRAHTHIQESRPLSLTSTSHSQKYPHLSVCPGINHLSRSPVAPSLCKQKGLRILKFKVPSPLRNPLSSVRPLVPKLSYCQVRQSRWALRERWSY